MLASAPVLCDPGGMLISPGRGSHFWWTMSTIQSWARASQDVMYLWRSLCTARNGMSSGLVQVSLNQKVDDWMVTQPPIPIVSSVANAPAASCMLRWQKRLSGMVESSGSKESRIQSIVSLDSLESFLLSVFGSLMRTQSCFSRGTSLGSCVFWMWRKSVWTLSL